MSPSSSRSDRREASERPSEGLAAARAASPEPPPLDFGHPTSHHHARRGNATTRPSGDHSTPPEGEPTVPALYMTAPFSPTDLIGVVVPERSAPAVGGGEARSDVRQCTAADGRLRGGVAQDGGAGINRPGG